MCVHMVFSSYMGFPQQSKSILVGLGGDFKLLVCVPVHGCLFYVYVQGVPYLLHDGC